MKLYVIPDCDECKEVESWIVESKRNVSIAHLVKHDNSWFERSGEDLKQLNSMIKSFPALSIREDQEDQFSFLIGKQGIMNYIEKGFFHEIRKCPFLKINCLEKGCEEFVILKKGNIDEGACSNYMSSVLLTEVLMTLNKQRG